MILAQYSIRSKQDYIFKTNRVLEIVGASERIAKIWEVLFQKAEENSIKYQKLGISFSLETVKEKFADGTLQCVELFCGGGNETILFDSQETFKKLNKAFSYELLKSYPGIVPMTVCVETDGNDYSRDYAKLMTEAEHKKNMMEPQEDIFTVPFAMMDRTTFQPYSKLVRISGESVRMSDESYVKYQEGKCLRDKNAEIKLFEEMVTAKGKESLLAVVHADGNNMGSKISGMLGDEKSYDKAVGIMREFTEKTADCFEKNGEQALKACRDVLKEKYKNQIAEKKLKENSLAYRRIIGSGDDMTFICNARFAMEYVQAYLDAVQKYDSKWKYSSCAGICIFHSHYPFSRAYSLAEQACDSAKKKVHKVDMSGNPIPVEQGWVDFHFIHNGIGGDLDEIRHNQGIDNCIARPWLLSYEKQDKEADKTRYRYEHLLLLKDIVLKHEVSRRDIKTIGSAFERNENAAKKELIHLYGHHDSELKNELMKLFHDENTFLRALYDFAEIYDLWYGEAK